VNADDLFRMSVGGSDGDADNGRAAIVLVRGSWTDNTSWQFVRPLHADNRVVVAYDRRGHSRSGPVDGSGTRRVQDDDLIEIVERLDRGPVHPAGNSYDRSIVLGVAARRPEPRAQRDGATAPKTPRPISAANRSTRDYPERRLEDPEDQGRSRIMAIVSRSCASTVAPTLPRTSSIRRGETARMC
jgi:pimeloyl-ACP methyl ester carboxylesterase